ncbi:hypothetical protein RJT34_14113 [Clitoria ternatea]|uniref:Uncharacterized protein n=1 Tax=Clitoria ternatea TaxID=43366 RepID=A0AAN9JSB7_CLITE
MEGERVKVKDEFCVQFRPSRRRIFACSEQAYTYMADSSNFVPSRGEFSACSTRGQHAEFRPFHRRFPNTVILI